MAQNVRELEPFDVVKRKSQLIEKTKQVLSEM